MIATIRSRTEIRPKEVIWVANHTDEEWEAIKDLEKARSQVNSFEERGKDPGRGYRNDLEVAERRARDLRVER